MTQDPNTLSQLESSLWEAADNLRANSKLTSSEFAMQGAQDAGEFFTPPSLVQTIVNVIEPDHGIVLDPACGSGGMFVQTSHFLEHEELETAKRVTF
jgi:type I restriction-modification system DNA methylase subunit